MIMSVRNAEKVLNYFSPLPRSPLLNVQNAAEKHGDSSEGVPAFYLKAPDFIRPITEVTATRKKRSQKRKVHPAVLRAKNPHRLHRASNGGSFN